MKEWERIVDAIGPLRIVAALGALFVAVGLAQVVLLPARAQSVGAAAIDLLLLGGPGVSLLYGARRLPRTRIEPAVYGRVLAWVVGSSGLMLAAVGLLVANPEGEITRPLWAASMAAAFGSVGGFSIGVNEARAISRARDAEQHNRELEQVQAKLRETVDRLEESNDRLEESNDRLEEFAYAASHDLQEPLRMVSSYLQLIEDRYGDELDEDGEEFVAYAVDGAERMREMIEALLEYSRIETESEPFEPVSLESVLEDVLDDLQVKIQDSDAEITIDELPRVRGDERQLRQLFQNLLSNAIEYSGDDPPRVHVSAERDGEAWTVAVSDEGIGIDPSDRDRIFEVFQRLHSREEPSGTGIGLALCNRIVERHGGDIWVESSPGDGSTFYFTLPHASEQLDRRSPGRSPQGER